MNTTWIAASDGCRIEIEAETSLDAAREYVLGGGWEKEDSTQWVNVTVWEKGSDDYPETHKIAIEPNEPACVDSQGHDWQSPVGIVGGIKEAPGVYGHGGGITIQEVCLRCGCGRLRDTWAQDPQDGRQGLASVEYQPGKYESEVEALREAE
jgi:hypothetical protein